MKRAKAMEEGVARLGALDEKQEVDDGGEVTVVGFVDGVAVAAGGGGGDDDGEEDDEAGGDEVEVRCGLEASPGPLVFSIQCLHQAANRDPHSFVWRRSH